MRNRRSAWLAPTFLASLCFAACSPNEGGLATGGSTSNGSSASLDDLNDAATPPGCGNGELTEDEACDDGNLASGDGCAANCLSVEAGYSCNPPGSPCQHVAVCGDGVIVSPELCDNGKQCSDGTACTGNAACAGIGDETCAPRAGDGCSPTCRYEPGYKCDGTPSVCTTTNCGDGNMEGAENCEDGNALPFDGCSALCQIEPDCTSGACVSGCGDGIVVNEDCDDGNNADGDGCDADCKVESGYECASPLGASFKVPMVVRDFDAGGDFEKGSDFATNLNFANQGLLQDTLQGDNRKPVLAATTGTYNGAAGKASGIASADSFAMWYDETVAASVNTRNGSLATSLLLCLNEAGTAYVNRFGNNGDGQTCAKYEKLVTQKCIGADQVAKDADGNPIPCYACYYDSDASTPVCDNNGTTTGQACNIAGQVPDRCELVGSDYMGTVVEATFDGNPLFFPADAIDGYSPAGVGQVSGNYDGSWPTDGGNHNFSFTSEVRYWFQYSAATNYSLRFVGDDDVWVFINGHLAVDLGGIHTAVQGDLTITGGVASTSVVPTNADGAAITYSPSLELEDGKVYEIVVLHAERQTTASSYQLTLSGFSAQASECKPDCGDGIIGVGEMCDDGINDGGYGECGAGCVLEEYCGDGIVQDGEDCDDGNTVDGDGCGSACRDIILT